MTMTAQAQLDQFHRFASEHLAKCGSEITMQKLLDPWTTASEFSKVRATDVAAVREAVSEMEFGDRGRSAEHVVQEVCEEFELELDR